jgi:2-C-methyl-D-erythritol 4-phosphate cytidylyltransferase
MIIVGGGSSTRFGTDKLLAEIAGKPLMAHTIDAVIDRVDVCVVVSRPETVSRIRLLYPGVGVTPGGATRTLSEMAGLAALGGDVDLVGIHDAARPLVEGNLVDRLFSVAASIGGAVPVLEPDFLIVDRRTHRPVPGLMRAQTPQVFRGPGLITAYARAAQAGFEGHDTAEVVQRFGDLTIVAVAGSRSNLKVTYLSDMDRVREGLSGQSRT